jgi:hypothetical protein
MWSSAFPSVTAMPAASISRRASRVIAASRSAGFLPRSWAESSAIASWHWDDGFSCLADLITILLDDVRVVPGFSSKAERNEQIVQINQSRRCNARSADLHSGAGDRVQHPSRDDGNYTGRCLDVNYVTNGPSLTVMTPDTTPIKWMPPVMDDDFLPDMGTMTPQCVFQEKIAFLRAAMRAEKTGPAWRH